MKRIHTSHWHYSLLLTGFGLLLLLFFLFRFDVSVQRLLVIATGLFYFFWGIFHHVLEKDLHLKIVLEYLLIALLGIVVCLGVLFRL